MTISPVSYSSYQNFTNIKRSLSNNPQIPESQVAFKGLEKVTTKSAQTFVTKNGGTILATLAGIFGITALRARIAYGEIKQKTENKYGIEIIDVLARSYKDCGCHSVIYTHHGKPKICYLSALSGENTKTEVLERLCRSYDDAEEFPMTEYNAHENAYALKMYQKKGAVENVINSENLTEQTAAFLMVKQEAENKFGIEITKVYADSEPSKGDCHRVNYMHNGEARVCYLSAPPGGNTKREVLERLISDYNTVEEFPRTKMEGTLNKTALKKYRENKLKLDS